MATPRELSHPLLWTIGLVGFALFLGIWFGAFLQHGKNVGRNQPVKAIAKGGPVAKPVDQMAIINAWSDETLAKGKAVFNAACASCHGVDGHSGVPNARKFGQQAFQNVALGDGASPLSMYVTLTKGWNGGAMPAQAHLSPEDRYAVIQYIRETFVKGTPEYRELTDEYRAFLAKTAPAPEVPDTGPKPTPGIDFPHPATLPLEIPIYGVLSSQSAAAASNREQIAADRWLSGQAAPLSALVHSVLAPELFAAVQAGDRARFAAALGDSRALERAPALATLDTQRVDQLWQSVQAQRLPILQRAPVANPPPHPAPVENH